jgi:Domain of unknown function (DUF4397)
MNKADKFKLLYIFGISLIFYFMGCLDTSVQNLPKSIDYHSQLQIINLASVSGAATINVMNYDGSMDGTTGQLNVGDAYPQDGQPFMDIPSGTKTFNVTFAGSNTSFKLTVDTERKIRLILVNPDSNSTSLVKGDERYIWQEKNSEHAGDLFPTDTASISFFNASPAATVESITVQGTDIGLASSLAVGKGISYMKFSPPGNYSITFQDADGDLATATINAQSQGKYSAILYGTTGNLQAKVYTDD